MPSLPSFLRHGLGVTRLRDVFCLGFGSSSQKSLNSLNVESFLGQNMLKICHLHLEESLIAASSSPREIIFHSLAPPRLGDQAETSDSVLPWYSHAGLEGRWLWAVQQKTSQGHGLVSMSSLFFSYSAHLSPITKAFPKAHSDPWLPNTPPTSPWVLGITLSPHGRPFGAWVRCPPAR